MKRLFLITLLPLLGSPLLAQGPVEIARDDGTPRSFHQRPAWEESAMLQPRGPARVLSMRIYYSGSVAGQDTIHVTSDPSEGGIPPTHYVWSYSDRTEPILVDYSGTPGWVTVDLSDRGLHTDGLDRFVVQHRVRWVPEGSKKKSIGPFFTYDRARSNPLNSFIVQPDSTVGQIPGYYAAASGDFLVRITVQYDYPSGDTSLPAPPPSLVDLTKAAGLVADTAGNYIKASRVSVADWDQDGDDDIAIGSSFFRNKGDGTFENVSSSMNISASATTWADYDNDGDLDVYAINGGTNDALFRNDGGTFTSVKATAGIDNPRPTVTPIFLDIDKDGLLDLFIANGRTESGGNEVYFPDVMFHNEGGGRFQDITNLVGFEWAEPAPYYDCWGASATDFNQDGYPDIHVATYRLAPDLLYQNQGNGSFMDVAGETGVIGNPTAVEGYFGHGVGTDWGDFNNDGWPDLAVGNLGHPDYRGQFSNPSLIFRNPGAAGGVFPEVHKQMGLKFFEMNTGLVWLDLDNDGYLDMFHAQYSYYAVGTNNEPRRISRVYSNRGPAENYRLADITWHTGLNIHGAWTAVRADFDRDGRMDLLVASPHEGVHLYHNDMKSQGKFVALRLGGSAANKVPTEGVGSRVRVYCGGKVFYRELMGAGGGTTSSQNTSEFHFGLGNVDGIDSVVIDWANGTHMRINGSAVGGVILPNHHYRIGYPDVVTDMATSSVPLRNSDGSWRLVGARYADGGFQLLLDGALPMAGTVDIVDMLGSRIAQAEIDRETAGALKISVDVPAGVYLLRVTSADRIDAVKVAVP